MSEKLIPSDDSREAATQAAIDRDTALLLGELDRLLKCLGAKVAPLIKAEPDEAKRRAIIDRELQRIRQEFETATQAMVAKFGEPEH